MADPAPETRKKPRKLHVPAENSMNEDLRGALLMQEEKSKQLMEEKKLRTRRTRQGGRGRAAQEAGTREAKAMPCFRPWPRTGSSSCPKRLSDQVEAKFKTLFSRAPSSPRSFSGLPLR